jgi:hypothetical protein
VNWAEGVELTFFIYGMKPKRALFRETKILILKTSHILGRSTL